MLAGCQSPPMPDVPAEIVNATLVSDPIQFQTVGAPTDAVAGAVTTLSLSDAVRMALNNDAELQAVIARVRIALAEAKQARLLPNPVLDVAIRYPEGGGKPIIDAGLSSVLLIFTGHCMTLEDIVVKASTD